MGLVAADLLAQAAEVVAVQPTASASGLEKTGLQTQAAAAEEDKVEPRNTTAVLVVLEW